MTNNYLSSDQTKELNEVISQSGEENKYKEHQLVSLKKSVSGLLEGTLGTIVHICADRRACEVEFSTPAGAKVVTLLLNEIGSMKKNEG